MCNAGVVGLRSSVSQGHGQPARIEAGSAEGQERQAARLEQLPEGVSKLFAHCAVQQEIYGAVEEHQHIHDLPELLVAGEEPGVRYHRQEAKDALRHLRGKKQHKNSE